ncbi:hypothetical protein [Tropicimonas sp.]|uniref:hypothetical protein n=1 Tax=Tropicimonas sp. TaxID=2067044 RepID=UPI003A86D2FA
MSDLLLLGGVVLCALSLIVALVQLIRMEPPRAAVIVLILGIVAMFAGAYLSPAPVTLETIPAAWMRLTSGNAV